MCLFLSAGSVAFTVFKFIQRHSQPRTYLKVWAILSALKTIVWLTETNLNTTDCPEYSLLTPDD